MSIKDKVKGLINKDETKIYIESIDQEFIIRTMKGYDRANMWQHAVVNKETDMERMMAFAIVKCCFDPENNERAFDDEDLDWITDIDSGVFLELGMAALKASGLAASSAGQFEKNS